MRGKAWLLASVVVAVNAACGLGGGAKDRCQVDADCNGGQSCVAGTCGGTVEGGVGSDAASGRPDGADSGSDAATHGSDASSVEASAESGVDSGSTWTPQSSGSSVDITAVWGVSKNFYAVAVDGSIRYSTGDGNWQVQTSGTTFALYSVWGSGAGDVYVGGADGTLLHSAGDGTWIAPVDTNLANDITSIWGSGAQDVYVAGNGAVAHSTGNGQWSGVDPSGGEQVSVLWGASASDLYGINSGGASCDLATLVQLAGGDGSGAWGVQWQGLQGSDPLQALWGSSANDVYAVGGCAYDESATPFVLHSTGDGTWTPETLPSFNENLSLNGISGTASSDVYVVGDVSGGKGIILHRDGRGLWTQQGTAASLKGIWATPGDGIYAVGVAGTILYHP